jgi:hypothetical protein
VTVGHEQLPFRAKRDARNRRMRVKAILLSDVNVTQTWKSMRCFDIATMAT